MDDNRIANGQSEFRLAPRANTPAPTAECISITWPKKDVLLGTTIMRFDTAEHLEALDEAPERCELLAESKASIDHEHLKKCRWRRRSPAGCRSIR